MKKILLTTLMLVGVSVVAGAQGPPPARVVVGEVTRQELAATQSVTGVLYYDRVSNVSTEVAGLVDAVAIRQGDTVAEGDLLVRLNTDLLDKEIALTRTRIEQAELRINNTEKNYQRLTSLYERSGVSEKEFDDAEFAFNDAQLEKQALEKSLAKLQLQRNRSVIKAPFGGVVLNKNVDVGAWVQQGRELASIGARDELFVRAPVTENLLSFIRPGETVAVVINAFDRETQGTIVGIDPVADVKTKNVFVKIRIEPLDFVAENMSVLVHVPASEKRELSVFSRAGLIKFQGKDFIYTVKEDKASILPVNIVAFLGQQVAVDNPYVVPGLPVVIEGNERLRPDQPVTVVGGS